MKNYLKQQDIIIISKVIVMLRQKLKIIVKEFTYKRIFTYCIQEININK